MHAVDELTPSHSTKQHFKFSSPRNNQRSGASSDSIAPHLLRKLLQHEPGPGHLAECGEALLARHAAPDVAAQLPQHAVHALEAVTLAERVATPG